MHRGRFYPFHPTYWATESTFYPGWIPWRMWGRAFFTLNPAPWDLMVAPWLAISDPGIVDSDNQRVTYNLDLGTSATINRIVLSLYTHYGGPDKYLAWEILGTGGSGDVVRAWNFLDSPVYQIFNQEYTLQVPVPPFTGTVTPIITFRPATYAEGGSPWPPRVMPVCV